MDWTSDGTTRAAFLSRGAKGGLALVAGGSVLAATTGTTFGAATTDTDIAKLAATAELLAIDFYTRALGSKRFTGAEEAYMAAALQNEKDHYKALAGVLKSAAPKGLHFAYPAGTFASGTSIGKLGQALETAFVGAYLGAVTALKIERPQGRRGDDRRERVAPPRDPLEHRGGHDRLRAVVPQGVHRGPGDEGRDTVHQDVAPHGGDAARDRQAVAASPSSDRPCQGRSMV